MTGASLSNGSQTLEPSPLRVPLDAVAEQPALLDHAAVDHPAREAVLPGTRLWFVIFLAWMAISAFVALSTFEASEAGQVLALRAWVLALLCFYLALCNTFLPLPTAWIVFLAASDGFALIPVPWLRVLVVATVAAAATVMANLNEYHLLAYLLRFGLGRRVRQTRVYGWALRWFDRAPFGLLTLIAFVPLPVDAVRWLAVLRHYSRPRFALAYFAGRWPRYALFAWLSVLLGLTPREILLIQVGLVGTALLTRFVWWLVQRHRRAPLPVVSAAVNGVTG